jgi:hypothetical protein
MLVSSVSPAKKKKVGARVKWSDHFGGDLSEQRFIEGESVAQSGPTAPSESWNDRKKRDREKERKLLGTMKYVHPFCTVSILA